MRKILNTFLLMGKKVPDHLVKDAIDMLGEIIYGE